MLGIDPEAFGRVVRRHLLLFDSGRASAARVQEVRMVVDQLIEVLVAGDDDGADPLLGCLGGECPYDVVGLPVLHLDGRHAETLHDFATAR